MQNVRMSERHEVKEGGRAPQPGPRNLQQENQIGMRLLSASNTGRGLGGFGHPLQYTAIKSGPGFSYHRDVLNCFAGFESFTEIAGQEDPLPEQSAWPLDEAERGERGDRSAAEGNAHDHACQDIA